MDRDPKLAPRLVGLPRTVAAGHEVPVALSVRSRLLGLALLEQASAGPGLLLPRCRSIHTFGMRFYLKVAFLDARGRVIRREVGIGPGRILFSRRASAVLEIPIRGGEPRGLGTERGDGAGER